MTRIVVYLAQFVILFFLKLDKCICDTRITIISYSREIRAFKATELSIYQTGFPYLQKTYALLTNGFDGEN